MTQYIDDFCITDDVCTIGEVVFGNSIKLGDNKKYGIWKNEEPYVQLEVDKGWNPFDDAHIFGNKVYVGNNDKIIIMDLSTLDYRVVDCEMYFGYFYEYGNLLFVATGENLMCFQENGEMKWKTEMLAVDGVTFGEGICNGKMLEVSCCMDPCPAMWCDKVICVETGEVLSVGNIKLIE